jgi:hypothetical protein
MGAVQNPHAYAVENVVLNVQLAAAETLSEQAAMVTIHQNILPAGSAAPYGAWFVNDGQRDAAAATATLIRAERALHFEHFSRLEIEAESAERVGRQYRVTAILYNPGPNEALQIRAVVTLRGSNGRVAGYRVATVGERLLAGERLPLEVLVTPQEDIGQLSHTLYVEGLQASVGN